MIKAKDIIEKLQSTTLTVDENAAIAKLEKITDEAIINQFWKHRQVHIDVVHIDNLIKEFGDWRENVLLNAWKDMYAEAGWNVKFEDQTTCYWTLTAKA